MMKVTFLGHSGFLAELPSVTLLFDWWKGELPALRPGVPLYVFASHRHEDHFKPEIFRLDDGEREVRFLLGHDIHLSAGNMERWGVSPRTAEKCRILRGGQSCILPCAKVEALSSTDEGAAFLVCADGMTVFHAGDLNWWPCGGGKSTSPCCPWTPGWGRTASGAQGTFWSWRISGGFCPCTSGRTLPSRSSFSPAVRSFGNRLSQSPERDRSSRYEEAHYGAGNHGNRGLRLNAVVV